jgi:hypothetical protein
MSLIAVLVFLVVVGTIGALMIVTPLVERLSAQPQPYPAGPGAIPAPRDGESAEAAVRDVVADSVEPEVHR